MAQNALSGVRTRHIDTRYHYVRENLEEWIINIKFVKPIENNSDIFTKNVSQEIYDKHVMKFLGVIAEEYNHWTFPYGRVLEIYPSCSYYFRYKFKVIQSG
jgi:hypothetical protein